MYRLRVVAFLAACLAASSALVLANPVATPNPASSKPVSLLALAGYEPLSGEGVVLTLSDRATLPSQKGDSALPGLVHDFDVLSLVNELRSAGAQGISVGGVRLTNQSSIRCVGPALFVNHQPVLVPLRIEAVGNAGLLKARLEVRGGIVDNLKTAGPKVQYATAAKLRLKAAPLPAGFSLPVSR